MDSLLIRNRRYYDDACNGLKEDHRLQSQNAAADDKGIYLWVANSVEGQVYGDKRHMLRTCDPLLKVDIVEHLLDN